MSRSEAHGEQRFTRRQVLAAAAACGAGPLLLGATPQSGGGRFQSKTSPGYEIAFTHSLEELTGDLLHGERGDPHREADLPHAEWYSHHTRRRFHAWGPEPRRYAPLERREFMTAVWQRERVIATALRFLGYGYQHHHIPDWDPPAGWPWAESCVGHNGKGVDCSNLSSFVYNQGFGIHMNSEIRHQSALTSALEGRHDWVSLRTIALPRDYTERQRVLRTGDLLFVRGRENGPVTHVVLWVGSIGRSASGVPLVIDSHGGGVVDDDGQPIPCGVQLRPFRQHSWYDRCASHAHRVFGE